MFARLGSGIACAATVMLLAGPAAAFRTAENMKEFVGASRVGWRSNEIPFVMTDTVPAGLAGDVVTSLISMSLAQWAQSGCGQPSMQFGGYSQAGAKPGDGINTIHWVTVGWSRYGFPDAAGAMTDVQYQQTPDGSWQIIEADIYLNADGYDWTGMKPESMNLGAVILHEGGHVLGLLHNCEVSGLNGAPDCASSPSFASATMFPTYQTSSNQLGNDDIAGTCYLYPGSVCPLEGCGANAVCTAQGCQPSCGENVCLTGYTCQAGNCVETATLPPPTQETKAGCDSTSCANQDQGARGSNWDACTKATECAAGLTCSSEGYCTTHCTSDADCPLGTSCHASGECRTTKGAFGDGCKQADDCASLICLEQTSDTTTCSRSCEQTAGNCPSGWSCTDPDGLGSICTPVPDDSGCGCLMLGRKRQSNRTWTTIVTLGVLGLRLRRRRRSAR